MREREREWVRVDYCLFYESRGKHRYVVNKFKMISSRFCFKIIRIVNYFYLMWNLRFFIEWFSCVTRHVDLLNAYKPTLVFEVKRKATWSKRRRKNLSTYFSLIVALKFWYLKTSNMKRIIRPRVNWRLFFVLFSRVAFKILAIVYAIASWLLSANPFVTSPHSRPLRSSSYCSLLKTPLPALSPGPPGRSGCSK